MARLSKKGIILDAFLLLVWALLGAFIFGVFTLLVLTTPRRKGGRPPLEVEWLGVRIAPAAHTWSGLGTTANVSDAGNWTGGPVVAGDTLTFDGSLGAASNKSATWDAAAPGWMNSISVSGAYTGTVTVALNALTTTLNQTAAAGQVTVATGDQLSIYNYTLNASTLNGPGAVYANSMTATNGANISGSFVTAGGSLQVNGDVNLNNAATLLNAGTATWNAGWIQVLGASQINNTGIFNANCDQMVSGANGAFNNPGRFTKTGGTGSTSLALAFNNQPLNGTNNGCNVSVNSGTLKFTKSGVQAGQFNVNGTNCVLEFASNTQTLNTGTVFQGSGTFLIDGDGIATTSVVINIYCATFQLGTTAGTLDGSGLFKITGAFKWNGGQIDSNVNAYGATHITAATMDDGQLTLYGPTTWDTAHDIDMTASSILNLGAFTANNNQTIANQPGMQPMSVFTNGDDQDGHRGSFTKAASATPTVIDVDFQNLADFYFSGSQVNFTQNVMQSGANSTMHLDGGTMQLSQVFDLGGGTLFGAGTIQGSITVEGTIDLGSAVVALGITGNYTQNAAGTLKIKIGGAGAGQYDTLSVGGTATLGGAVQVALIGGYTPLPTDQFQILAAFGGVAGNFGTVTPGWTSTPDTTDDVLSSP